MQRDRDLSIPDHIHMTAKGRLVLVGGNHKVARMLRGENPPAASVVAAFHDNIRSRIAFCHARSIGYQHHVFPDPMLLATEDLPDPEQYSSYYLEHFNLHDALPI